MGDGHKPPTSSAAQPSAPVKESPAAKQALPGTAERRQLTVLFCDLVGSSGLAARLDPEDFREIVMAYQACCREAIEQYEGLIAQYLGDGVLVYFGYPMAHEDDARRAVDASFAVLRAIDRLNDDLAQRQRESIQVRLGIHTGTVVIGQLGDEQHNEILALGEAPNVAAELQSIAEPGSALIGHETYQLVRDHFQFEAVTPRQLKGTDEPQPLYRVVGEIAGGPRKSSAIEMGAIFGRDQELQHLIDLWQRARSGQRQVVLVSGEPGIGKSHLVRAFIDQLENDQVVLLEAACSAYHTTSAFQPVIELLESQVLGFRSTDSQQIRAEKLRKAFNVLAPEDDAALAVTAQLLSIQSDDLPEMLDATPEKQRQRLIDLLIQILTEQTKKTPCLFVLEDLHWADDSTLSLVSQLVETSASANMMLVLTSREDLNVPWPVLQHLPLERLSDDAVGSIISLITGGGRLNSDVMQDLLARSDGIPLFVEEMTKSVLESGLLVERDGVYHAVNPGTRFTIPSTLQDSLMARLDRLNTVKVIAQVAAIIGREFTLDLLCTAAKLDREAVHSAVRALVESGLVHRKNGRQGVTYSFKHALVQDTAYQSLLRDTRRVYHGRIARALSVTDQSVSEPRPERIAHHYTEAGMAAEAITYWLAAGQSALQQSANVEAVKNFERGLALVGDLSNPDEAKTFELVLTSGIGMGYLYTKGYTAPEVSTAYARARQLCQETSMSGREFSAILWGLWSFYFVGGDYVTARNIMEQLLELAEQSDDDGFRIIAHTMGGLNQLFGGLDLDGSRSHFEKALELFDPQEHSDLAFIYGQDPAVVALSYFSWTLWLQGYPDHALQIHREALQRAAAINHPFSRAYALAVGASFRQFLRTPNAGLELAVAGIELSQDNGFPVWELAATFTVAWAKNALGVPEEAVQAMEPAVQGWMALGCQNSRPHQMCIEAEIQASLGSPEAGLTAIDAGLAEARDTGEIAHEAELYRLKGQLLLVIEQPDQARAESCLREAMQLARLHGALSWELRAAVSLARLLADGGRCEEAHSVLKPVYERFTEGHETRDLSDAAQLIGELELQLGEQTTNV